MPAISDDFHSTVTAGLHCEDDTVVSRDQVCRSSQYGLIERKSIGSSGNGTCGGAYKTQVVDANRYPATLKLTFYIGGYGTCNAVGPQTTQRTPTRLSFCAKTRYLSAEKVKEIEHWLAEVDPEGDDGSLEVYSGPPFPLPCKSSQESWLTSILHRL